jgi:hypothetical protein
MKDPDRLLRQLYATPRDPEIDARKKRFSDISSYIAERGGWMTSVPGDRAMRFEAMPLAELPAQLRELGYIVEKIGETKWIMPHTMAIAIVEMFELRVPAPCAAPTSSSPAPLTNQ